MKLSINAALLALAAILVLGMLALVLIWTEEAEAVEISLPAIAQIESSGRDFVVGDNGHAFGRYQITAPVIREHGRYTVAEAKASPAKQEEIARWYLGKRIPAMIRAYGRPVTVRNILVAYNAGIAYVKTGKPLPKTTRDYLKKYERLTGVAS